MRRGRQGWTGYCRAAGRGGGQRVAFSLPLGVPRTCCTPQRHAHAAIQQPQPQPQPSTAQHSPGSRLCPAVPPAFPPPAPPQVSSTARIVVQGRNLETTPAIKQYCEDKVGKAVKNFDGIKEVGRRQTRRPVVPPLMFLRSCVIQSWGGALPSCEEECEICRCTRTL